MSNCDCNQGRLPCSCKQNDTKSELAALREDLASVRAIAGEAAGNSKRARGEFKESRNILQQRLAAAEQRNAELISAVRSINRGKHHEVLVPGDDEPQYRQRKEWVDWVLGLCDEASGNKPTESGARES